MAGARKPVERMCIACRAMKDKSSLIRIVRADGVFGVDFTGKKNGRGAYICNDKACMERCVKSRLLNKNFKCEIPREVYEQIMKEFICGGQS